MAGSLDRYLSMSLGPATFSGTKWVYVIPLGSRRFMNSLITLPMTRPLRPSNITRTCLFSSTMRLWRSVRSSASSSGMVEAMFGGMHPKSSNRFRG